MAGCSTSCVCSLAALFFFHKILLLYPPPTTTPLSPSIFIIYYLIFIFYSTTPRPHSLTLSLSSFPFLLCVLFVFFSPTPYAPSHYTQFATQPPYIFLLFSIFSHSTKHNTKEFPNPPTLSPSHRSLLEFLLCVFWVNGGNTQGKNVEIKKQKSSSSEKENVFHEQKKMLM